MSSVLTVQCITEAMIVSSHKASHSISRVPAMSVTRMFVYGYFEMGNDTTDMYEESLMEYCCNDMSG